MPPPPPSPQPPSPPALMEELVEEILLRIPPDDPAHLFRAALVCKLWRRIILSDDTGFLRAPPLLAYYFYLDPHHRNRIPNGELISTAAAVASPPLFPLQPELDDHSDSTLWVHDCRHGRVLIELPGGRLIVQDPITGDQNELLSVPKQPLISSRVCAVLCAVDGCDHLDCHAGPFLVVYCATSYVHNPFNTWVTTYSSETREWSAVISISIDVHHCLDGRPTRLIRNALYFSLDYGTSLLKYDLIRHELSVVSSPRVRMAVAMELDDGGLGLTVPAQLG